MSDLRDNQPSLTSSTSSAPRPDVEREELRPAETPSVPCVYCMAAIPSGTFVYWTHATRLLSADCPECTRRTTLAVRGLGPMPLPAERGISVIGPNAEASADTAAIEVPMASMCACGHALDEHDVIASRYCDATLAGVLARGCICLRTPRPRP
jgi:hypothetical protein